MERGEIERGARGYTLTVLTGTRIEKIPLHYIGLQQDYLGPGYDLHLVQLEGPIADHVGIAAGMSGSPVYIDGRLIGALSYRIGTLPKDAIAGVTPIESMRDAARAATIPAPVSSDTRPIMTPLTAVGLHPALRAWAAEQMTGLGFLWTDGGQESGADQVASDLVPGSPVGLALVRGDWSFAATGTVTAVEDGRVLAFGHPFLGVGEVEFPMVAASILHTLADAAGSRKLASIGNELGAIVDDRLTAVVGRFDRRATMIPITVRVRSPGRSAARVTRLEVVNARGITPLLAGLSIANAVIRQTDYDTAVTVLARGTIRLQNQPDLPFEVAASGASMADPSTAVASQIQQTLAGLWNNPFERASVTGIEVEVDTVDRLNEYTVETLQYDREAVRPGASLKIQCVLRPWRGDPIRRELVLQLPHGILDLSGLRVAVGPPHQIERALGNPLARRFKSADDLGDIIRVLGEYRSNHRLVAVLYDDSPTLVRDGSAFSQLPATAAHLLASGGGRTAGLRIRASRLAVTEIEMDGPVRGGLAMRLQVDDGLAANEPGEETP